MTRQPSPEIVANCTNAGRDYSVYAADPLEAILSFPGDISAPIAPPDAASGSAPHSTPSTSSKAVIVGKGLLSWALNEPDQASTGVVGTIVKDGGGESYAVEVVLGLREVCIHPLANLAAANGRRYRCLTSLSMNTTWQFSTAHRFPLRTFLLRCNPHLVHHAFLNPALESTVSRALAQLQDCLQPLQFACLHLHRCTPPRDQEPYNLRNPNRPSPPVLAHHLRG